MEALLFKTVPATSVSPLSQKRLLRQATLVLFVLFLLHGICPLQGQILEERVTGTNRTKTGYLNPYFTACPPRLDYYLNQVITLNSSQIDTPISCSLVDNHTESDFAGTNINRYEGASDDCAVAVTSDGYQLITDSDTLTYPSGGETVTCVYTNYQWIPTDPDNPDSIESNSITGPCTPQDMEDGCFISGDVTWTNNVTILTTNATLYTDFMGATNVSDEGTLSYTYDLTEQWSDPFTTDDLINAASASCPPFSCWMAQPDTNGAPAFLSLADTEACTAVQKIKYRFVNSSTVVPGGGLSTFFVYYINYHGDETNFSIQHFGTFAGLSPTEYFPSEEGELIDVPKFPSTNACRTYQNMSVSVSFIPQAAVCAAPNAASTGSSGTTQTPNPAALGLVQGPGPDPGPSSGCSSCSGSQSVGNVVAVNNLGVSVTINAGKGNYGTEYGTLSIYSQLPSTNLGSPVGLSYVGGFVSDGVAISQTNQLAQVLTPQMFANINIVSASEYQIECYTSPGSSNSTTGLYNINSSAWFQTVDVQNVGGNTNDFRVTVDRGGPTTNVYEYIWSNANQAWTLSSGGGLLQFSQIWNASLLAETNLYMDASTNVVFEVDDYFENISGTNQLIERVVDPQGAALTTLTSYYDNSTTDGTNYGKVKQIVQPSGFWQYYIYNTNGSLATNISQFLDAATNAPLNQCRVTTYDYTPFGGCTNCLTIVQTLAGQETSRHYQLNFFGQSEDFECQTPGAAWTDTNNLITVTNYETNYYLSDGVTGNPYFMQVSNIVNADGTVTSYQYSAGETVVDSRGTETTSYYDSYGNLIETTVVDLASGIETDNTYYSVDSFNRPTSTTYVDGSSTSTSYSCCGPESTTDRQGAVTTYTYDVLNRLLTSTKNSVTISNVYDAMGRIVQTVRIGTDASAIVLNSSTYDTAGRLSVSTDAMGNSTTNAYGYDGSGNSVQTNYNPDGSTQVQTTYQDGSQYLIAGTAVYGVQYSYGADTNGASTTETKLNGGASTSEWVKTYTGMTGQNYLTIYPDSSSSESFYNNLGQLWKQVDQDGVATLYLYDTNGIQQYTIIDTYGDGLPHLDGTNQVTQVVRTVLYDSSVSANVVRNSTYVWQTNGVNSPTLIEQSETAAFEDTTWDIKGNVATYTEQAYGGGGLTVYTGVTVFPSGGWLTGESDYTNDVLMDAIDYTIGAQTDYGYDAHGRQNKVTDHYAGTTTTNTYNNADQITSVTTPSPDGVRPGLMTSNLYDSMGRTWRTILPDGTSVTNQYYTTGSLYMSSGSRTYPVQYTYDYAGRTKTMTTWQNFASSSGAAVTTWNYDANRGWVTSKVYNDGHGPSYTYSLAGRLKTRTWARGVTTTNTYNNAGQLVNVGYSDGTSSVGMAYNRQGRQSAVTQGSVTTGFVWDNQNDLLTESYSGGPLNGLIVTDIYDALGDRTNLVLLNASAAVLSSNSYNYGSYSVAPRLQSVSDGTNTATYNYVAHEAAVDHIAFTHSGTAVMTTQNTWDNLWRLTGIASTTNGTTMTSFQYGYNTAGQRVGVTNEHGSYWIYQYDALGQLISGKRYWSDGTPVAGQQYTYGFDTIGNRQTTQQGGDASGGSLRSATYTPNLLNQYTQRMVPGAVDILGSASSNATVGVNNMETIRHGDYYDSALPVANTSTAVWQGVTNVAMVNNGTNAYISVTNVGNIFVPQTPENYGYDLDGNLTNDGRWIYTWDAENRLTSMTSLSGAPAGSQLQLAFTYDYMGRRIQKIVSTNYGGIYIGQYTNYFVYDGWNCIGVLNASSGLVDSFLWGSDLSDSVQGAGGVGGLLEMTYYGAGTTNTFAGFDGNGNVGALINAANGQSVANYEYGPFGEVIRATGPMAKLNPFRFSTKYDDDENDLVYYGYRYYNSSTGRWINRDPIEEAGENNIYGFVRNDEFNNVEYLGEWFNGVDYSGHASDALYWNGAKEYAIIRNWNLTVAAMDYADGTYYLDPVKPRLWALNSSQTAEVESTRTYAAYLNILKMQLSFWGQSGSFSTPPVNLNFKDYDGKSDGYYAFGDARFRATGYKLCGFATTTYYATIYMNDTYVFDDNDHHYDQLAWYTPTKVGYDLESHGWIRRFRDQAVMGPVTIEESW